MNAPRNRNNGRKQLDRAPAASSKRRLVSRESESKGNYNDGDQNLCASSRQAQMVSVPTSAAHVLPNPGSSHNSEDYYDMSHVKRSVAIIFNHRGYNYCMGERKRSESDKATLELTLQNLDFEVRSYDHLTLSRIIQILTSVATDKDSNEKRDCLVVVVHTHGNDDGRLCASDCSYDLSTLWEPFTAKKCPSLAGKPKLFFIQTCRGIIIDHGVTVGRGARDVPDCIDDVKLNVTVPSHADILISYAVFEGPGSWFTQILCSKLLQHARTMELTTLLTDVQKEVCRKYRTIDKTKAHLYDKIQPPCYFSSLTKHLMFR